MGGRWWAIPHAPGNRSIVSGAGVGWNTSRGRRRMAQQQVNGACLELEHDPFPGTARGATLVLLWGMSLLLVPVGALMLWSSMHPFDPDITMGMGFLLMLFGLICLFGGSNQKAMTLRVSGADRLRRRTNSLLQDRPASAYVVPFSRVAELRVRDEQERISDDQAPRWWFACLQCSTMAQRSGCCRGGKGRGGRSDPSGAGTPAGLDRRRDPAGCLTRSRDGCSGIIEC